MDYFGKVIVYIVLTTLVVSNICAQPIEVRTYHDDSNFIIKEQFFITDSTTSILSGPYKSYYLSGCIEKEGYYKNNLPDSLWTYFYESGQVKMRGTLKFGANHGLWEYFFENQLSNVLLKLLEFVCFVANCRSSFIVD